MNEYSRSPYILICESIYLFIDPYTYLLIHIHRFVLVNINLFFLVPIHTPWTSLFFNTPINYLLIYSSLYLFILYGPSYSSTNLLLLQFILPYTYSYSMDLLTAQDTYYIFNNNLLPSPSCSYKKTQPREIVRILNGRKTDIFTTASSQVHQANQRKTCKGY